MNLKVLIVLLFFPLNLLAAQLEYELYGYGTKHLVIIISGQGASDLSSNLSSDGLSLRVSGIDAGFEAKEKGKPLPSAISQLNQVKREAYTDLLLSFSMPFELNVQPGTDQMKLVLKSKEPLNTTGAPSAKQTPIAGVPTSQPAQQQSEAQAALLEQLTAELVRLRAELETKDKEISKLKEACNVN